MNPGQVKTSLAAIWSLVFGILSFCLSIFGFIPALILGIVGIAKINGSEGRLQGKGLAIAGIISGSVGLIFGTGFLAAILMPAFSSVRDRADFAREISHVKQLSIACRSYALDHDGVFPQKLRELVPDYMDDEVLLKTTKPKTGETEDYIYFPGLTDTHNGTVPLIASPVVRRGKRVVGMVGGQVRAMGEVEYQDAIAHGKNKP